MKTPWLSLLSILVILLLGTFGCYPNFEATELKRESLSTKLSSVWPTKAYLVDASVVLFPSGFLARGDTVIGQGQRVYLDRLGQSGRQWRIPLDSILAMTSYESKTSAGRGIASFLLGLTGSIMTPLSIYCVSCPKCCFGSCPTVYVMDSAGATMQAELFSHSISRLLEAEDLDKLECNTGKGKDVELLVTNEALETHYIKRFSLLAVSHPPGTTVLPSADNRFVTIRDIHPPLHAVTREGTDILAQLAHTDSLTYRTGIDRFAELADKGAPDEIVVSDSVPPGTTNITLVIRLRNTLLSTILFYDVVLGSQGIEALNWNHRMDTDEEYAAQFKQVYDTFSGLGISVQQDGKWVQVARIKDVGPITWKTVASAIPVPRSGPVKVRLRSFPDNFIIDQVGFSMRKGEAEAAQTEELVPRRIVDDSAQEREDIRGQLARHDGSYLVTNPGESYRFTYHLTPPSGSEVSLFIQSQGYYTEWIRGNWLRASREGYRFDLSRIDEVLSQLGVSWIRGKDDIEHRFFQTRIPLRSSR